MFALLRGVGRHEYYRNQSAGETVSELWKRLEGQAADVSRQSGKNVEAVVLGVSLQ